MPPAETLIVEGAVSVIVATQPVPATIALAPVVKRKPEGKVSVNAMPDCIGLPAVLVKRKFSGVTPPARIEPLAKLFVRVGVGEGVMTKH
jgi:hypothetical protein